MRGALLFAVVLVLASGAGTVVPSGGSAVDDLGREGGYGYDDAIAVTGADGLNATEREAMTARAMARLERLRGIEFTESVHVSVVSREAYGANHTRSHNATDEAWNNQVWKAPFLVGADRDVSDVFNDTYQTSVAGYYEPGSGNIVLVSDSDEPRISRQTLVHELVHALQDQQFGLASRPDTQDRQLARNALVEGEAERLAGLYEQRCVEAWSCVEIPRSGGGSGGQPSRYQDNAFLVIYYPYVVGPDFVDRVATDGGTAALDRLYADLPDSTEQVTHADAFPEEAPANVTVPDRSGDDWRRFDHDPVADTVGEASIYAMAVANGLGAPDGGRYSYRHPVSVGWGGDAIVPYRDGDRFGYVWETAWDSEADAREFHEAYRDLLTDHGAEAVSDNTHRIPANDPFGGSYRLTLEGTTVRIVHGPTTDSLAAIHGS